MAIIPQLSLFSWNEIEELGDLERLHLVIEYMPDEEQLREILPEFGKHLAIDSKAILSFAKRQLK
jgi:hypothetical protein